MDDWKKKLEQIGKGLFKTVDKRKKETEMPAEKRKASDTPKEILEKLIPTTPLKSQAAKIDSDLDRISAAPKKPSKKGPTTLPNEPSLVGDRITVGLDFGTSFTKVCFRKELGGDDVPIYPLVFETLKSPLFPSTVSTRDEKIYFGQLAFDNALEGYVYPHVKVCLACNISNSSSTCVSARICPFVQGGPTPSELMSLYLAWIMKEARQHVPPSLGKSKAALVFNVGVPVKHLDEGEDGNLTSQYRKIVYDAWRLSEGIFQGADMKACQQWIHELKDSVPSQPENSPVQLAPETSAAIVSYINSGESQPGLCSIVDIGAWTTDISFFRVTDVAIATTGVSRLAFYSADVWRVAANAIDARIIECIIELIGEENISCFNDKDLVLRMQYLRESGSLNAAKITFCMPDTKEDETPIPDCAVDFSRAVTSEAVRRHFASTFKNARKKEPNRETWKGFTLFLTGGGSHETCFPESIRKRYAKLNPRIRNDILGSPALEMKGDVHLFKRMAVAAGLSYPLGMWPDQLRPSEVTEWTKPPMIKIPEADDEPG